MIFLTAMTIGLGLWINSSKRQHRTVTKLKQIKGNRIIYTDGNYAPPDACYSSLKPKQSWAPGFLYQWIGPDYFHRIDCAWIVPNDNRVEDSIRLCKDLSQLRRLVLFQYDKGERSTYIDLICDLSTLEELEFPCRADWLSDERIQQLRAMRSLKKLRIAVTVHDSLPNFDLSKLSRFDQLEYFRLEFEDSKKWTFSGQLFQFNSNLKSLHIDNKHFADYVTNNLDEVAKCFPNLESLSFLIDGQPKSFAPLTQLKKLKSLRIGSYYVDDEFDHRGDKIRSEVPGVLVKLDHLATLDWRINNINHERNQLIRSRNKIMKSNESPVEE